MFDRFGYNMARNGDMEHATSVTHYAGAVVANRGWDWLLFHEMSHHWWGDWVTCGDWRDLWLNEGFASYCEALGMEWVRGEADFRAYVKNDLQAAARNPSGTGTIYDPDYFWGTIVYEKGACVMHMLRYVMGDSLFFTALQDYGQQFAFSTATTADFQTVCETHYDSTLQWFFDQWVFEGVGYPRYEVTYDIIGPPQLTIHQQQTLGYFTMPIEVEGYVEDAIIRRTYWVEPDQNGDWLTTDIQQFDSVRIDPEGWILKLVTYHLLSNTASAPVLPESFELVSAYPNPFNPTLSIEFVSPAAQPVTLRAFDVQGRLAFIESFVSSPGSNTRAWNASDKSSGIYWIQLTTPTETRTVKAVLLK
ncbi:MAG: T9SS type A sorting domain-containing protein [bacterium]|nr:T9SS type A sorting domain-containing protein [bacterium]